MTDKPMLFQGPMVKAMLEDRKTQTRRLLKIKGHRNFSGFGPSAAKGYDWRLRDPKQFWCDYSHGDLLKKLPLVVGDRVWVKETWAPHDNVTLDRKAFHEIYYRADHPEPLATDGKWRSPLHMFQWASRLTLTITDVRIQRVQDISEADARAEGFGNGQKSRQDPLCDPVSWYHRLWDSIHGPDARDQNPYVAAYTFTVQKLNIGEAA